ncbi:T9SS type A sorting domain-containing protein [Aureibaculum sp. A20]|uniref:T9SS type A sorting domain-containing protein n=1 Tax=Aureibaculum flavum TaxID=2795986 RepID=A0ABS0WNI6_9FLAO|nr:T9SS type A sorting domain-containing protein [Aureibaculum flavum]MBJ2173548.1 T9SS type A sorting domain-containing protein [Aureibaculum flavum]
MSKNRYILILGFLMVFGLEAQNTIEVNCQNLFLSGTNLAWNQFSGDVGFSTNPNLTYFNNFFSEVKASGGNSVRWWLHTDAAFTPEIQSNGNTIGLHHSLTNQQIIDQIRDVLDAAWSNDVLVNISLFSFDMLQDPTAKSWTNINYDGNLAFLKSSTNVQSYIDNALTPMVNGVKDHPALMSWEIFNEPEGMTTQFGWTPVKISMADVQMVVNKLAGAIHDADPDALVTNGTWSMLANTDKIVSSNVHQKNYYSDAELIAAGGANNGTLDFYQVHYYNWQSSSISPFHHPASYWDLDKPVMVGEFHAVEAESLMTGFGYPSNAAYDYLYDNGYFGAWGWQYNESTLWNGIAPQINYMDVNNGSVTALIKDACNTAGIDDFGLGYISIFPNPSVNQIQIKGLQESGEALVYSIDGKIVINAAIENNQLDVSQLTSGMYYLRITTEKGSVSKKFLKK